MPGRLVSAALETPDPEALAARWALALGLTVDDGRLYLDDGGILFREGRTEKLAAFGLYRPDAEDILARAEAMGLDVDGREIEFAGVGLSLLA